MHGLPVGAAAPHGPVAACAVQARDAAAVRAPRRGGLGGGWGVGGGRSEGKDGDVAGGRAESEERSGGGVGGGLENEDGGGLSFLPIW